MKARKYEHLLFLTLTSKVVDAMDGSAPSDDPTLLQPLYFHVGQYQEYDETCVESPGEEGEGDDDSDEVSIAHEARGTLSSRPQAANIGADSAPGKPLPEALDDAPEKAKVTRKKSLKTSRIELKMAEPKRNKRKGQPKTAGPRWFNMPRAEATPQLKTDAKVLQARGYVNPKRFYKKTDAVSEFAQLGTVIAGAFDRKSDILAKRRRKSSLTAELVADQDAKSYARRKYREIQAAKQPRNLKPRGFKDKRRRRPILGKVPRRRLSAA